MKLARGVSPGYGPDVSRPQRRQSFTARQGILHGFILNRHPDGAAFTRRTGEICGPSRDGIILPPRAKPDSTSLGMTNEKACHAEPDYPTIVSAAFRDSPHIQKSAMIITPS